MKSKRLYLAVEFLLLFFGIPSVLLLNGGVVYPTVVLLPALIIVGLLLRFTTDFKARELVGLRIARRDWLRNGLVVILSGGVILLGVWLFNPKNLFNLPRGNPRIWLALCIFYPLFSAYLQEIVYRTFLFRRYGRLFRRKIWLIAASALAFSFAHILYYSPLSMILTLAAGFYLAHIYAKTGSVLFTAILHGLLGNLVFTVGLGQYFWLDMLRWI